LKKRGSDSLIAHPYESEETVSFHRVARATDETTIRVGAMVCRYRGQWKWSTSGEVARSKNGQVLFLAMRSGKLTLQSDMSRSTTRPVSSPFEIS
jgi:hypothetical protein